MTRTSLINYLIAQRNFRRYLEISMRKDRYNFKQVQCDYKQKLDVDIGVDPDPAVRFSAATTPLFDIILIDGIHTEEQVLSDFRMAMRSLAKGGVILLHDCLPPDEWHQREPHFYREGEPWNGTVWKAALRIFNTTEYYCSLLDTDWGCGIIDTSKRQSPACRTLPKVLDYNRHFSLLSNYKISVAAYFQEQVQVFYHLACMGNWQQVFCEQMRALKQSRFDSPNLTVLGTDSDLVEVNDLTQKIELTPKIIFHDPELTHFEKPAMLAIQDYAKCQNGYVLYLHSKGVSKPVDSTKIKWRNLMMHELVEKWENCIRQLPDFDLIGVNWCDTPKIPHFSGNFWYASTTYLRTLKDFEQYYKNPQYHVRDVFDARRLGCEFWIGSASKKPRLLSLAYRNASFTRSSFWEKLNTSFLME